MALDVPPPEGVRLPYGYLRFAIDGLPLPLPLTTAAAERMIPNAWVSQEGLTIKTNTERRWRFDIELPDAELVRRLPSAPEVKKMSTTAGRIHLFLQEDMDARAKIAERYRPDLFIDLHYDSQLTDQLQSARDDVAVYVPGAVGAKETGAKNQRADALKHLLEVRRWKQSTKAAKSMVDSLARNLGLPLLKEGEPGTMVRVADGVFARNIFETKRATSGISAFFESFHYDHTREFPRLTVLDRTGTYRGKSFRYPARLDAVVTGIRDGLLAYFRDFSIED